MLIRQMRKYGFDGRGGSGDRILKMIAGIQAEFCIYPLRFVKRRKLLRIDLNGLHQHIARFILPVSKRKIQIFGLTFHFMICCKFFEARKPERTGYTGGSRKHIGLIKRIDGKKTGKGISRYKQEYRLSQPPQQV